MMDKYEERLIRLETQMDRFASDIDSEKRTRAVAQAENHRQLNSLEKRLRRMEFWQAGAIGAIAVLEFVARIIKP